MRRLPIGMLVGGAEPGDAQRGRIGKRAAEIGGAGAGADRGVQRCNDRCRVIGQKLPGQYCVGIPAANAWPDLS